MQTWNKLFVICLTSTVFLAAGVIFLPRYFSRKWDSARFDKVESVYREKFSYLEQSSNGVLENSRAFRHLNNTDDNLMLIASYDETAKVNMELLEAVYGQAMMAADWGVLPWIGYQGFHFCKNMGLELNANEYWVDKVRFAKYYSLTYDSDEGENTKEMMNFWYLRFSDGKNYDYYFLVNAATYKIYYAEVYNACTDYMVRFWEWNQNTVTSVYNNIVIEEYDAMQNEAKSITDDLISIKNYIDLESDLYLSNIYWSLYDSFPEACLSYYEAEDYKHLGVQSNSNRQSLVVLNYGNSAVYIEQLVMPQNTFPYRGISVGLQNLGENVNQLLMQ